MYIPIIFIVVVSVSICIYKYSNQIIHHLKKAVTQFWYPTITHYDPYDGIIRYYKRNGINYINEFPHSWIHLPTTGPESCSNCRKYGSWSSVVDPISVFVGYCKQCAEVYQFKRGVGFSYFPVEMNNRIGPSVYTMYLKNNIIFRDMARISRYEQLQSTLLDHHLEGFEKNILKIKKRYEHLFLTS
jgi:hypothetical protein